MLLAQVTASPSPQALKDWIEVLLYIASSIAAVAIAWHYITRGKTKTEITDQPIQVKEAHTFITQKQLDETHGRISRERREVDAEAKRIENELKERMVRAEENIGATREDVASLKTETTSQTRQLHQIQNTIENLPEKILRLQNLSRE